MTTTMPSDNSPAPDEKPIRTPAATSTTVDTQAGTFAVQAGTEQYPTQDHGLTAPRPVVTFTVADKTTQLAAPEAETFGRALMFAAVQATQMEEVNQ